MRTNKPRKPLPLPDLYGHLYEWNEVTKCLDLTEDELGVLPETVRFTRTHRSDIASKAPYCLEIRVGEILTGLMPVRNEDGSAVKNWFKGDHLTFKEGREVKNALLIYYPVTGGYLMLYYARSWFPKRGFGDSLAKRMISDIKKRRPQQIGA